MNGAGGALETKGSAKPDMAAKDALEDLSDASEGPVAAEKDPTMAETEEAPSSRAQTSSPMDESHRPASRQPSSAAASKGTTVPPKFAWLPGRRQGKVEIMERHLESFRQDLESSQTELRQMLRKQGKMLAASTEEVRQLRGLVVALLEQGGSLGDHPRDPEPGRWKNFAMLSGEEEEPSDEPGIVVSDQDAHIVVEHFADDGAFRLLLHTGAARAWRRAGCGFVASATRFLEFVREVIELESAHRGPQQHDTASDLARLRQLTAGDILDCIMSTSDPTADPTSNPNPESNRPEEHEGIVKVMELRHLLQDARFSALGPVAPALVHFLGLDDPTFANSTQQGAASELGHAKSRGRRTLEKPKRMRRLYYNTAPPHVRPLYANPLPEPQRLPQLLREAVETGTHPNPMKRELVPSVVCVVGELGSGRTELIRQAFGTAEGLNFLKETFLGGCVYVRLYGDDTTPEKLLTQLALGLCIESEADGKPLLVQLRDILINQGRTLLIFDEFPTDASVGLACTRVLYDDLLHGQDATEEIFNAVLVGERVIDGSGHSLELTVRKLEMPSLPNDGAEALLRAEAPTLAASAITLNAKAGGNPLRLLSMSRYLPANAAVAPNIRRKKGGLAGLLRGNGLGGGAEKPTDVWERLTPENRALLVRLMVLGNVTFSTATASAIRTTSWTVGYELDMETRPHVPTGSVREQREREILHVDDVGPTLSRLRELEHHFFLEEVQPQHWRVTRRGLDILHDILRNPPSAKDEAGTRFYAAHSTWLTQSARAYVLLLCNTLQSIERLFRVRSQRKAAVARLREERAHLTNLRVRLRIAADRPVPTEETATTTNVAVDGKLATILHLEDIFTEVLRSAPMISACVAALAGTIHRNFADPEEREALWRDLRWLHGNAAEADASAGRHIRAQLATALNDGRRFSEASALLRGVVGELRREATRPPLLVRSLYELARSVDGLSDSGDVPLSDAERGQLETKSKGFFASKKQAIAEEAAAEQDAYESFLKRFEVLNASDEVDNAFVETQKLLKEALGLAEAMGPEGAMDSGRIMRFLGDVLAGKRELEEALRTLRQALHVQRRAVGEEHPDVAATLTSIAVVHQALNDPGASADAAFEAFEVAQAVYGRYHAVTIETLADCATALVRIRSLGSALRIYGVAEERAVALHGSRSIPVARIRCHVARVHEFRGEADEAVRLCQDALEMQQEVAPEDPQVIDILTQLAELHWQQQSHKEAYDSYKESLRLEKKLRGKLHVSTGQTLRNMALLCHDHLSQEGRAVRFLRAARIAFSSSLGEQHEYTREVDKLMATWDAKADSASVTGSIMSRLSFGP